jgi:hypothetical protein
MDNIQEEHNKAILSQDELKDIEIDQFKEEDAKSIDIPRDGEDTSMKNDKSKISYQLGSSNFMKLGFLVDEKIPNRNGFHIDNDGLASWFQNNKYPMENKIFQIIYY